MKNFRGSENSSCGKHFFLNCSLWKFCFAEKEELWMIKTQSHSNVCSFLKKSITHTAYCRNILWVRFESNIKFSELTYLKKWNWTNIYETTTHITNFVEFYCFFDVMFYAVCLRLPFYQGCQCTQNAICTVKEFAYKLMQTDNPAHDIYLNFVTVCYHHVCFYQCNLSIYA